ncbi:hypothetical protein [Staphylococcus aureus]|uniref:hypothetical protein n=1 Tax=Staphylococcus aureus TaxID=1280 RepID=UPI0021514764|nr:hypothetical protein [Staphylococcus aureus]MCR6086837.1 hypothetical protein [Staphylococcus aureus]
MKITDLDLGDEVWFIYPQGTISYPGIVKQLNWNFEKDSKPTAIIDVAGNDVEIDDTYQIAIGRKYNAED